MKTARWILLVVALTLTSSICAVAYPFHEVRCDTVTGISRVNYIDPILDWDSHQLGFVLCDSSTDRLLVNLFDRDTLIQISMPCAPVMTVTRVSGDSIIIYGLLRWHDSGWDGLTVGAIIMVESAIYTTYRIVPTYSGTNAGLNSLFMLTRSIRFAQKSYSNKWKSGVIVETTMEGFFSIPGDAGVGTELVSTAVLYDLQLDSIKIRRPYSALLPGTFLIADSIDYVGIMNLTAYKPADDTLWYAPASVLRGIRMDSSSYMTRVTTGYTHELSVDRINGDWMDDVIVHARHSGFLQNHPTQDHLAAYSVKPDTLTELWYLPLPSIYPLRWQLDGYWSGAFAHLLWRGDTCLYRFFPTGDIVDSTFISSGYDCKILYDFDADLYLALRNADTLRLMRWDVPTSVEDTTSNSLPSSFTISQNYPNPFNSSTEIRFSLARASEISVTVYNLLGQQVKSLVSDKLSAGEHRVSWDGTDNSGIICATGLYLYRMQAEKQSESRKMLLLK